jgi:cytochrome c-type biogenesis protein CcmH
MLFWAIAVALIVLIVGAILRVLLADGAKAKEGDLTPDMAIYRDQLAEVERDLARGVITEDEATRARLEIQRRILDADKRGAQSAGQAGPTARWLAVCAVLLVGGGALALYSQMGAAGYPDMPLSARLAAADEALATRPSQAEVEVAAAQNMPAAPQADAQYLTLVERLRTSLAEGSTDPRGFDLLAQSERNLGNFVAAYQAKAKANALKGDAASGQDFADEADMMVLAAGGFVSPETEQKLRAALERDPRNGIARYYFGLMRAQTGRPDIAFQVWNNLLRESKDTAPWVPTIRAQIEDAARLAGVDYTLPPLQTARQAAPALPGPDAEAMAAAADMTPEERMEMIEGMVTQLGERLATEGGSPQEWARMIGALGILGQTERAAAIWGEAQSTFATRPDALEVIRAAAVQAGVAQ